MVKHMILSSVLILAAIVSYAGTSPNAKTPEHVRDKIAESANRWASHPLGIPTSECTADGAPHSCCTGSGAGVCNGVSDCTGSGAPAACCTGSGAGSCLPVTCGGAACCVDEATDQECTDFAAEIDQQVQRQAWRIEQQTVYAVAFDCNPFIPSRQQDGATFCLSFPATQTVVDSFVATACSFLAHQ